MTIKEIFKNAQDTVAPLTLVRRDLAAALSKRDVTLADMPAVIEALLVLQARADAAVAAIPAQEEALRGLERELVIYNHDEAFAERDAKLHELAMNRDRIAVLKDEGDARIKSMRKALVDAEDREFAVRKGAEYEALVAKLNRIESLEAELVEILEAARDAHDIRRWMWDRHKQNPDVEELNLPYSAEVDKPVDMLKRVAKAYTDLVDMPPSARRYL